MIFALLVGLSASAFGAPVVSGTSPSNGPVGTQVTITGTGFGVTQGTSTVQFNGVNAASIQSWSDTQVVATVATTSTTGPVKVTVSGVASNTTVYFTVPAPLISGISPSVGVIGTQVTISGAGFQAAKGSSSIQFNGINAATTSWNDTQIIATVPAGAKSGVVRAFVNNVGSNADTFFTLPNPSVRGISPSTAIIGSQVTISGTGFGASQGTSNLQFNNVSASIQSWSDTQIVATLPSTGSPARVSVTVGGVVSNNDVQISTGTPRVISVSPTSAIVGSTITISGSGFGSTKGSSYLQINGYTASTTSWSDTQIVATVPPGAKTAAIRVYVNNVGSNSDVFLTLPNPVLAGLSPSSGPGGTQVTLSGSGFGATQSSSYVQISGINNASISSWSDTQIVATVPANATTGQVWLNVGGVWSPGINFNVPGPRIDAISPSSGVVGTQVTISGANFGNSTGTPRFNNWIGSVVSWSDTQVVATVPGGASSGPVTLAAANNASSNSDFFFSMPRPSISGVSPDAGKIGDQITITGQGFGASQGTSSVQFNGTWATNIVSWSDTQIVVVIPSGATSGVVRIFEGGVPSNTNYSITIGSVLVSAIAPSGGPVGTQVTITGQGFGATQGTSTVSFNNVAATSIQGWSDTQIVATVPSGATTGATKVTVGGIASNTNRIFTVSSVVISSASPMSGAVGTQVTINGSGFGSTQGSSTLQFNGATATIQSWTATQIVATVPATTTGPIKVTVAGVSSNTDLVFAVPVQRIDSISPASGDVGTQVTITGANFRSTQGSSYVFFNTYWGGIVSWSDTQIVATASDRGSSGPISVNVGGIGVSSSTIFTYPNPIVTGVSPSYGSTGTQVTISGSGFKATQGNSTLDFGGTQAAVQSWSDTQIVATVPAALTTNWVRAMVGGKGSNTSVYFTVVNPTVTSVSPASGAVGTQVTITGSSFGATQGSSTVNFTGGGNASIVSWSDTQIVATAPPAGVSGTVRVWVRGVGSNADFVFTYPTPLINNISPTSGPVGSQVTINGSGFGATQGSNVLYFFNSNVATIQGWSDAQIVATVPTNAATGLVKVVVGGVSSNTDVNFTVPPPSVMVLSPAAGVVGDQVTITGSGFRSTQGNSYVQFNGVTAMVTSWSATQIVATVPAGATTGPVRVNVNGSWNNNGEPIFTMAKPLVTGVTPGQGPVTTSVTVAGSGFGATQSGGSVFFNNQAGTVTSWADTQVVATVPVTSTTGPVRVTAGGVNSNSEFYFNVPPPAITALTPATAGAGNPITIIGLGFQAAQRNSTVRFNNGNPAQVSSWSDTQIVAIPPAGTSTGPVKVTVNSIDSNTDKIFTIPSLAVSSISPTTGPVSTQVTINGSAFGATQGTSTVTFAGSAAASIQSWNNTQIVATVPVTAITGPVKVTVNSIDSNATVNYTVPPPVVSSLSPNGGGVGASTQVTITGSGFQATQRDSSITFNGISASVVSWSNTQIVATAPTTATTGPVVVTVNGIASNSQTFTVVNPVISELTPPAGARGGIITVKGSGFGATQGTTSNILYFNGVATNAAISSWTDTAITALVPQFATSGPVTVAAYGVTSNGVQFTVQGSPTISSASPSTGYANSVVTINGSNFGSSQSNSVVAFNGLAATPSSWSNTQIVVPVPTGATNGPITVTVAGLTATGPSFTLQNVAVLTDSLGHVSLYQSTVRGGQTRITNSDGPGCSSCTLRGPSQTTYDAKGNVLSVTDALGRVTSYTYDGSNNMLTVSRQLNGSPVTTTYTYNSFGQVLTVNDPLNHVTTNTYDAKGNLLTITPPAPDASTAASVTTFTYDTKGQLLTITDPLSHVTTMTYTAAGQIETITDANQKTTTFEYDTRGNRTKVIDALQQQTIFAYDTANRLTGITYPDTKSVSFGYDSRGRSTTVTDQNQRVTTYAYDDADRMLTVTDPAQNVTAYAYDTENNLSSITDAMTRSTSFEYDTKGRLKKTTFPSSLYETYTYDAVDNLTSKTDRKGQVIQYIYDALNRLTNKNYPDSTGVEYIYDLVGKITQVNDPTGSYGMSYDNLDRLIGTTTTYSFLANQTFTNTYAYDAASNRTSMQAPGNGTTTYGYDALDRLTTETSTWAGQFGFSYDDLGRRTSFTRPNGVNTSYGYDSVSRLFSVLHKLGTTTIDGATYGLDDVGKRISKQNNLNATMETYGYDAIDQLTSVTNNAVTVESYLYDQVGNRTSSHLSSSYSVNSSNQLTGTTSSAYSFDNNGNTLTDSSKGVTYSWDFDNRLKDATTPAGTSTYRYDPFGRRIYRSGANGMSIWLYDADDITAELDTTGVLQSRYVHGIDVDEPLAMSRQGVTFLYEQDGLGSVTSLTDVAGALADSYVYDSYGNTLSGGTTIPNPFRYTGREWDQDAGLYYYRARYYNSAIGRFLSEDAMGFTAGNNFFKYVENGPTNWTDPSGFKIQFDPSSTLQQQLDYAVAKSYLVRDPGMKNLFAQLEASPTVYTISFNYNGDDFFDPGTNTVNWDPTSGWVCPINNGIQTPALGLGHELAHALGPRLPNTRLIPHYDYPEERRVIKRYEIPAAITLGEPIRHNHHGSPVPTTGPTSSKPLIPIR